MKASKLHISIVLTIVFATFLTTIPVKAQLKLHFNLESAIRQAQDSSITAFMASENFATARYAYDYYLSGTGPQVTFNLTPTYYKQSTYSTYKYALPSIQNMAGVMGNVSYQQQVSKWGGTVYAETRSIWTELLGDRIQSYGVNRYFTEMPLRVGYKQSLLGWNQYKWEHIIESHHNDLALKKFKYTMRQVAEQAIILYFDYVSKKMYRDTYKMNFETADTLFRIGEKKLMLTTVRKDELMLLEVSRTNALNQLNLAETQLENARLAFLSFLHINDCGQTLELENTPVPDDMVIDNAIALSMSDKNNPQTMQLDENILTAERDLDEARKKSGLQVGMDVSVGIQNINSNIGEAFKPKHYAQAEVTFSIPLWDSHLAANRKKKTESALNYAKLALQEQKRQNVQDVLTTINLIRVQQDNIPNAKHNMELADEAFNLVSKRYADGLTDMNTYQNTLSRKDQANQMYISLLNNFWTNYYKLTRLTMYDFITKKEL